MSDEAEMYAVYASKEIAPPANEYWAQRRRVAGLLRDIQGRLQTTGLATEELSTLAETLETTLAGMSDEPKLLGRKDWVKAGEYGDFGVIQTEVTPILGPSNPISPGLSIWFEEGKAFGSLTFDWMYEGNSCITHGGWVAAIFDEFLGTAQVISGHIGMTGSLTTRYHKPTPLNKEVRLEAKVKHLEGRKITMLGEMWVDDVMTASCEGLFITPSKEKAKELTGQ